MDRPDRAGAPGGDGDPLAPYAIAFERLRKARGTGAQAGAGPGATAAPSSDRLPDCPLLRGAEVRDREARFDAALGRTPPETPARD